MFLEMAPDQARIGVVTAAGGEPHNDANRLASIEIRDRFLIKSRSAPTLEPLSYPQVKEKDDRQMHRNLFTNTSGLMPLRGAHESISPCDHLAVIALSTAI